MSQPAVSDALARLRVILHDELLIPVGRSFTLSAVATRLRPQVEEALAAVESILTPSQFDPLHGRGTIRIATSDYIGLVIGPLLARMFAEQAPSMSFEIADTHLDSAADLRSGEIDLIVAPAGQIPDDRDQFSSAPLFKEEFVYLVGNRDGTPRHDPGEDLSNRPHVFYEPRGRRGFMAHAEMVLRQGHRTIAEAARVPSFLLIPFLIEGTDNVALLQRRVAERLTSMTDTTLISAGSLLGKVTMVALWNRARQHDPVHTWFREQLASITATIANSADGRDAPSSGKDVLDL